MASIDEKTVRAALLAAIPDTPVWVETRGALLDGGDVFGVPGAAVVRTPAKDILCLVGRPMDRTLDAAFNGAAEIVEVIAQEPDAGHGESLIGAPGAPARIYASGARPPRLPIVEHDYLIEELGVPDAPRLRHLRPDLREEIAAKLGETRVVASIVDGLPVSFCYPGTQTETLWDVSIDTWAPYRRRGLAAAAFGGMHARMAQEGKSVVWGAMEYNEASWRLADKLGLEQVGAVYVWTAHAFQEAP